MWTCTYTPENRSHAFLPQGITVTYLAYNDNLPNWSYPYHYHDEIFEFGFVVFGSGSLHLGGTQLAISPGDICMVPPNTLHYYSSASDAPLRYYIMQFLADDVPALPSFLRSLRDSASVISCGRSLSYIRSSFEILEDSIVRNRNVMDDASAAVCMSLIMIAGSPHDGPHTAQPGERKADAGEILLFINRHYADPLTEQLLAERFNISTSHLRRIFRDAYHVAPISYMIQCRIGEAANLLMKTEASVSDIAAHVGYDNPLYFSRLFSSRIGQSPTAFRRQTTNEFYRR